MPFHFYKAWNEGEEPRWFGVRVRYDEDHWVSTCRETDAQGHEVAVGMRSASKCHGVTAEEACRRMIEKLEDTYKKVTPAVCEGAG
jgi:hypothetical protein